MIVLRAGRMLGDDATVAWWSLTKPLIALACFDLAARGRLDLHAPVAPWGASLLLMLRHEAGVPSYTDRADYRAAVARREDAWRRDDVIAWAEAAPRPFAPGGGWAYSNTGYAVAARAVERAAGAALGDVITSLLRPRGVRAGVITSRGEMGALRHGDGAYDPGWVMHGLVAGRLSDAVRLLASLRDDPPAGWGEMTRRRRLDVSLEGRCWTEAAYGAGLMLGRMGEAGRCVGHSGAGPGSAVAAYAFPGLPGAPVAAAAVAGGDEAPAERSVLRAALAGG